MSSVLSALGLQPVTMVTIGIGTTPERTGGRLVSAWRAAS
jgi:hypothetical protein